MRARPDQEIIEKSVDALINYLETLQTKKMADLNELCQGKFVRLLCPKDFNLSPEIPKDENGVEIIGAEPLNIDNGLVRLLSQPEVLNEYFEKYKSWQPDVPNQKDKVDKFQKEYVDYFFNAISKTEQWKNFVAKKQIDENMQKKIAAAFIFKLNGLVSDKIASLTSGPSDVAIDRQTGVEKDRRRFLANFLGYPWGEDITSFDNGLASNRDDYFKNRVTGLTSVIIDRGVKEYLKRIKNGLKEITESTYFKSYSLDQNIIALAKTFNLIEEEIKKLDDEKLENKDDKQKALEGIRNERIKIIEPLKKESEKQKAKQPTVVKQNPAYVDPSKAYADYNVFNRPQSPVKQRPQSPTSGKKHK